MKDLELIIAAVVVVFALVGSVYSEYVKRRIDDLGCRIARLEGIQKARERFEDE